jgi:uncharacterized damage-inducible protein DinB
MTNIPEMTIGQWQARQIQRSARILSHFVLSTREDRLRWCPATEDDSKTRSVMDLVGECVEANRRILAYIRGDQIGPRPASFDIYPTVGEAVEALHASADDLAAEIAKLGPDDLMREVQTHRGPMPAALAMQFPMRNMTYHMGQINMIQLLYGDTEFHINESFMTL